ncbi:MAG: L-serine ammonia-lyase, iron-sulfur-dependent, subunit alpha [Clostridia bacterium]|nr:L-serine ammonia-lyase, iron-sulfur-dependent, subunit alpha [Clostridia bacterium]
MKSLKELFKIGIGPSSSHTIGPEKIAEFVRAKYPNADKYKVVLYGSLALTGKGHGTDAVLKKVLGDKTEIEYDRLKTDIPHPNTMSVVVYRGEELLKTITAISVGGGSVKIEGEEVIEPNDVYTLSTFNQIKSYVLEKQMTLYDYVYEVEPSVKEYLKTVWTVMKESVERGLKKEGVLPGGLNVVKKAKYIYESDDIFVRDSLLRNKLTCAYALAVAEENADNGKIVTAPTCGASGVLPAVLYYAYKNEHVREDCIINALATAGLIGNIVKTNASISGAECGCQAEIGTACSMAAAAVAEIYGLSIDQIECAAEVAMEHNLGLTCDPVLGLVQVPCIERNTMAAMRAFDSFCVAYYLAPMRKIPFDVIVKTMYETGKDLNKKYLETARGGIAKNYKL